MTASDRKDGSFSTDGNFVFRRPAVALPFTGERLTSEVEGQIEFEHLHRYCLARDFCKGRDVLDVASGEGYGSALLAGVARSVTGVEIDASTVAHAQASYSSANLRFLEGDALALPLPDGCVDVVVSFETLEHVADHARFMAEVRRVLRPGGLFVVSTPDRTVYSAAGTAPNPYHVLELTDPEFRALLQSCFAHSCVLSQRASLGSILALPGATEWRSYERRGPETIEATRGLARAVYLVGVASDAELPEIPSSAYLDRRGVEEVLQAARRHGSSEARANDLARELDTAKAESAQARNELQTSEQRRAEAEAQAQQATQEKIAAEQARAEAEARTAEAEARTTEAQHAQAAAERSAAAARAELDAMTDSLGWRLLAPFRRAGRWTAEAFEDIGSALAHLRPSLRWRHGSRPREQATPDADGKKSQETPAPASPPEVDLSEAFVAWHGKVAIHFPLVNDPEVSVIIPVYRGVSYVENCLRSLAVHRATEPSFEVILVDDCPAEPILGAIPDSGGLIKIANPENQGFLLACNRGAAAARGRYLCFLDSDTLVSAGWLSSLVAALKAGADTGIAGSMLLNIDGTIQEAGLAMDASGTWHPIGSGKNAADGGYTYRRRVDCVSSTCLAIERKLFEALGGFDILYAPGIYGEFDLVFRARARGLRTVYEPRSRVVHMAAASYRAEIRHHYAQAQRAFAERFARTLQYYPRDASDEFAIRHAFDDGPTLLVLEYGLPRPDRHAGDLTMSRYVSLLSDLGWRVVYGAADGQTDGPAAEALEAQGIEVIRAPRKVEEWLIDHGRHVREVWLARPEMAERFLGPLRAHTKAPIAYYTHDLHYLREQRAAAMFDESVFRDNAARFLALEQATFFQVDHVMSPSADEAEIIRELAPGKPVTVIPPYHYEEEEIRSHGAAHFESLSDIVFVGGFPHTPNVDAAVFMAKEVMPLVWKDRPEVRLVLIGYAPPPEVRALAGPRVVITGQVPQVEPFLEKARVFLGAMRFGAGVKGKTVDALRLGVPVVTTSIGAEGIGIEPGRHAIVVEGAEALAQGVLELLGDSHRCAALSSAGADLIRKRFSRTAARNVMGAVFQSQKRKILGSSGAPSNWVNDLIRKHEAAAPRSVPALKEGASVSVSIIVPVYNQWRFTRLCLNSALDVCAENSVSFELILADDGSTDETASAAEAYGGLKIVRTPRNLGFLRNCNHAARYAKGRYLVFLNNDTIVLPGWLSRLFETMERDPDAAIVGSKLVYPDGVLQEAGAVIFADGTALNVGRGYAREAPLFNIEREVDYVSGASIMVRRAFWNRVGGFDERYDTAYCEDSDLAMTARSLGMRVLYQPASEVVHFEHQSYADQAPSHNATLQQGNIKLLVEKWSGVLHRDHLPVVPWHDWHIAMSHAERTVSSRIAERRRSGPLNILYFSPFPSHPATHGNRATIQHFANYFRQTGHNVHFALLRSGDYDLPALKDMRAAWTTLDVLPCWNPMVADGKPVLFDGWYEEGLGERVRSLCERYEIDIVFCSYIFQSKLLEYVPSHVLKVIDTHDKMGDRFEMLRRNGLPPEFFSCTPEEEGAYLRRADLVVARRGEEARYFDGVSGRNTAVVIPHVEPPRFVEKSFEKVGKVGIVASANQINLGMVRDCLEAIDRRLAGARCPFTVVVAGEIKAMAERLPAEQSAVFGRPWVRMLGFVAEIDRFYAEMDLILAPVTVGTGINVKTVQAMAHGMPMLTTECGSKGIKTGDPHHCHRDVEALVASLFSLAERPTALPGLAELSRDRYLQFYADALSGFEALLRHLKLTGGHTTSANAVPDCEPKYDSRAVAD